MTDQAITKAIKDLNAIISNHAMNSFLQANRKKDGTFYKKRRPYTLTDEAQTALKLLNILNKNRSITTDEEEQIKAFLIPYRIIRTEFLINTDSRMS